MARKKADPRTEKARARLEENKRSYLYSNDCPLGKIFQGADAIAEALEDGWRDSPPDKKSPKAGKPSPKTDEFNQMAIDLSKANQALDIAEANLAKANQALADSNAEKASLTTKVNSLTSQLAAAKKKG